MKILGEERVWVPLNNVLIIGRALPNYPLFSGYATVNNAFNELIFSASTSELHRTQKLNCDEIVKTKLFEITDKIFFAARDEMV